MSVKTIAKSPFSIFPLPGAQAQGALFQLNTLFYPALYEALWSILGTTGVVLPFGDSYHGAPSATTFTTQRATSSGVNAVCTWSEAPNAFDKPLVLTAPGSYKGIAPVVEFNGTDEEADSPDAAFWTAASGAFSVGAWINPANAVSRTILSKWDETTAAEVREWSLELDASSRLQFLVYDETANAQIGRFDATAIVLDTWQFVVATYNGGTASSGIKLYIDGTQTDDTDNNSGVVVDMQDTAALLRLGMVRGTAVQARFFSGKMAGGPVGPFFVQSELTADQITRLYNLGRRVLAL